MKNIKNKLVAAVGGLGAICVLCCTLPILGLIGFGSLEALFCENQILKWGGAALAVGAGVYLIRKKIKRVSTACSIDCGGKTIPAN